MKPYVSCPLKRRWFNPIKSGKKQWEFRREGLPVARDALKKFNGSRLLIKCMLGYGGEICWKVITEILQFKSPVDVPPEIMRDGRVDLLELETATKNSPVVALHLDDPTEAELGQIRNEEVRK